MGEMELDGALLFFSPTTIGFVLIDMLPLATPHEIPLQLMLGSD